MQIDDQVKALRAHAHSCKVCGEPWAPCDDMYHCRGCYDTFPHSDSCAVAACVLADLLVELKAKLTERYGDNYVGRDRALAEAQEILSAVKL